MEEPRRIVLILGNGFDLDLGLKTSYKDFWESKFCPKEYPAPLIHHLNRCWPDNLDAVKWYDLENELLNYYAGIPNPKLPQDIISEEERRFLEDFKAYKVGYGIYNDQMGILQSLFEKRIIVHSNNVLCPVDAPYQIDCSRTPQERDERALKLIKEGLCKYLRSIDKPLPKNDTMAFQLLLTIAKAGEAGDFIEIFTFNYTQVPYIGKDVKGIPIHYMHGCCEDGKIIVGTRDDTSMVHEYDFLQKVMDDTFTPPDIVSALKDADEVIIFGHSLGENDRQYFAPFFLRQADEDNTTRKDITIFTRDSKSKVEIKRALQKMTNGKLSALYSINQPVIIRTNNLIEDQQLLFNFLVNHSLNKRSAEDVLGKLLPARQ
jgi:hypothetical protein